MYLELDGLLRLPENLDTSLLGSDPYLDLRLGAAESSAEAFKAAVRATAVSVLNIHACLEDGAVSMLITFLTIPFLI